MKRLLVLLLVGGLPSACASAQAKAPADRPALEVPPPPPRAIEPPAKAEPSTPEPVGDLPPVSPAPVNRPRPPATRDAGPRTDPKPPETAPIVEAAPPPAPPVSPPAPQLRTPGSASGPEAAKQVRDLLDRSQKALNSVNYQRLTTAQRGQYNTAKLMLQQAEDRLKGSDFDIARELADKASRIATELQGR